MPNVALFKQDGSQNGEITLNEEIFGIEPNESVVYDAIVMQRASLRQGTHAVKNRSAVRGGGRRQNTDAGSPLQGVRLHLSFQRNIRRTGCRVRLRAERRRVEEQYQALLVGFDGASS